MGLHERFVAHVVALINRLEYLRRQESDTNRWRLAERDALVWVVEEIARQYPSVVADALDERRAGA